jgi:hypothetical protein
VCGACAASWRTTLVLLVINYTLDNLQCYLMGEDLLIVTEAQSVVGPRRKRRR